MAACDGVMDCDAAILLNGGSGTSLIETDGKDVKFAVPPEMKQQFHKVGAHEQSFTPWLKQAQLGTPHDEDVSDSAQCPKIVYNKYLANSADTLLDGVNSLVYTVGSEETRKTGLILGDNVSKEGLTHLFARDLFKCKDVESFNIIITAYSYKPRGDEVTDLTTSDSQAELRDADAKRAGAELLGLHAVCVHSEKECFETLDAIKEKVNGVRNDEVKAVEKRSEEMSLRKKDDGEGDEVDLGFDSPRSPKKGVDAYIPEPFFDKLIVISLTAVAGEATELSDRHSSNWGIATFLILPDTSRPEAVGALSQVDVSRYEKVQKLNCGILQLLTAIRLKRRRIPFLASRLTSILRIPYRQTGEREDEIKLIKHASFRKKQELSGRASPSSPRSIAGKNAALPKTMVFLLLNKKSTKPLEAFHSFTCTKRFMEMMGSIQGLYSRHLHIEQSQMDSEIASLACQLEVAKSIHGYRPMLYGVKSKESRSIVDREKSALERKKEIIANAENEKNERISNAANHIADRNIQEERSRLGQVMQTHSDAVAKKNQMTDELNRWRTMSTADLDDEIAELNREVNVLDRQTSELEKKQVELSTRVDSQKGEMNKKANAMAAAQKKVFEELERKAAESRRIAEERKQVCKQAIVDMRKEMIESGELVCEQAKALLRANPAIKPLYDSLTSSVQGFEAIADRLTPHDPSEIQLKKIQAVRSRIITSWTHELVTMQKYLLSSNIPLPINPSMKKEIIAPVDVLRPVVRLHLIIEGMAGVADSRERLYSVAAQRHSKTLETPRRPINSNGVVNWHHKIKITVRLPRRGNPTPDLLTMNLIEFLPDGSLTETLPFDIDLAEIACKPAQQYLLMPCNNSDIRIAVHVSSHSTKRKTAVPNPLYTAKQIQQLRPSTVGCGVESDDE